MKQRFSHGLIVQRAPTHKRKYHSHTHKDGKDLPLRSSANSSASITLNLLNPTKNMQTHRNSTNPSLLFTLPHLPSFRQSPVCKGSIAILSLSSISSTAQHCERDRGRTISRIGRIRSSCNFDSNGNGVVAITSKSAFLVSCVPEIDRRSRIQASIKKPTKIEIYTFSYHTAEMRKRQMRLSEFVLQR